MIRGYPKPLESKMEVLAMFKAADGRADPHTNFRSKEGIGAEHHRKEIYEALGHT